MTRQMDRRSIQVLQELEKHENLYSIAFLAEELSLDQAQVSAICTIFAEEGLLILAEQEFEEVSLTEDGSAFLQTGLPLLERRIAEVLQTEKTVLSTPQLSEKLAVSAQEVGKVLRFLTQKGFAERQGKDWVAGQQDLALQTPDELLLQRLSQANGLLTLAEEESKQEEMQTALKDLRSRGFSKSKVRKSRLVCLSVTGKELLQQGIEEVRQVNQLTEEMMLSGDWKNVTFRPYDVQLDVTPVYSAKSHPLRRVLNETRRAFFNMGFEEIRGPYVESAFWDFDALFQPQDHPAREMQDTFYCERPKTFHLPEEKIVETIRNTHENGGSTGSSGWQYKWSDEKAKQVVLRTHTTAATVAHCYQQPQAPQKVFCVGRVFRRETIDYKHLPEFHQVDGIIVEKNASFANLLGTLKQFYLQMGFQEVKFRPAFFPYTEPSVEVFVRMPGKKEWLELGGAGVFRPEVIQPAGVDFPVLAWGLGLERLAMIRYQIHDIRQLYLSELNWLKEVALCR